MRRCVLSDAVCVLNWPSGV